MSKRTAFQNIVHEWAEKGLIQSDQVPGLIDDLAARQSLASNRTLILILGFIGAGCLAAAMFLFISSNWAWLPRLVKLGIAIVLPIIPIWIAGLTINNFPLLSRSMRLLAVLMVGGSVAIIGQIYAIDGTVEGLMRIWGIIGFVLAIVLVTEFGVAIAIGLVSYGLWQLMPYGWESLSRVFIPLFAVGLLSYAFSFGFVWIAGRFRDFIPERLKPTGDLIRALALLTIWFAMFAAYFSIRWDLDAELTWVGLYLVFYFTWLAAMIYVGAVRSRGLMRNGSVFMVLTMLFTLYCDVFSDYNTQALFYLGAGLVLLILAVGFERSIKGLSKPRPEPVEASV